MYVLIDIFNNSLELHDIVDHFKITYLLRSELTHEIFSNPGKQMTNFIDFEGFFCIFYV